MSLDRRTGQPWKSREKRDPEINKCCQRKRKSSVNEVGGVSFHCQVFYFLEICTWGHISLIPLNSQPTSLFLISCSTNQPLAVIWLHVDLPTGKENCWSWSYEGSGPSLIYLGKLIKWLSGFICQSCDWLLLIDPPDIITFLDLSYSSCQPLRSHWN